MPRCELCGKSFDKLTAEGQFITEADASVPVSYRHLHLNLCGSCAVQSYTNVLYHEICDYCGKSFFPEDERLLFEKQISQRFLYENLYERGPCCAECAVHLYFSESI